MTNQQKSILIIGATGLTGQECIQKLAEHPSRPAIHAFCRNASKLDDKTRELCQSIIQGNARNESDIRHALQETKADWVVVSIGNGSDVSKTDIRTASGHAIANVLQHDSAFAQTRTVVVSSTGAGTSRIIVGMGIGKLISFHLRHVLADHTGQEAAFKPLMKRSIVVRPTSLTTNTPTGKLVEFGDEVKGPSTQTDRADLAEWIAQAITTDKEACTVNITGLKK
jgi:NAD(P)-dependent dehydrogenase (short-subunit alcohol dehydrogenase family)